MNQILEIHWAIVIFVGIVGGLLLFSGFKLSKPHLAEQRDFLGVKLSERSAFMILNGLFLFLGAIVVTILKLTIS